MILSLLNFAILSWFLNQEAGKNEALVLFKTDPLC